MKKLLLSISLCMGFSVCAMQQEVYQQSEQERSTQEKMVREEQMRGAREAARAQKNLYAILQVERDACLQEITAVYRRLAFALHPDRPDGDADQFALVNNAYELLKDEQLRAEYDKYYKITWLQSIKDIFQPRRFFGPTRAEQRKESHQSPIDQSLNKTADNAEQRKNNSYWDRIKSKRDALVQATRERSYYLATAAAAAVVATSAPYAVTHCSDVARAYCAGAPVAQAALQACAATLPSTLRCLAGTY